MRHSHGVSERVRVAVFCGGWSEGREASFQSGAAIIEAIQKDYEVVSIDPVRDLTRFAAQIISARPDVILNVLHGKDAEIIESTLELTDIPHVKIEKNIALDQSLVTIIDQALSRANSKANVA